MLDAKRGRNPFKINFGEMIQWQIGNAPSRPLEVIPCTTTCSSRLTVSFPMVVGLNPRNEISNGNSPWIEIRVVPVRTIDWFCKTKECGQ